MKVSLVPSVITGIWPAFICMLKDYSENTYLLFIYCMCIYICIFNSGLVVFVVCAPINLVYIHFACFCHNSQQECTSILGVINKTNPRYIYFLIHVSRVSVFLFVFCRISQQQQPIMVHVSIPKLEKMKIMKSEGCTKKYTSYSSQLIKKWVLYT